MWTQRRALLRSLSGAGICLLAGPLPSVAQHHQHAQPAVDPGSDATLVFAAATLQPALDEVVRAHEADGGARTTVAYGPTPVLARNVVDGAPADVFFSADVVWMDYLAQNHGISDATRIDVVRNQVVLVEGESRPGAHTGTVGPSFPIAAVVGSGPIAMCNPDSHPAGRYARLKLQEAGLWDAIAARVAIVDNPQVAALMVARGDATSAVVFATDVHGVAAVRITGVFADRTGSPIVYPAALVTGAPHADNARRFLAYLVSPAARAVFDRFGYH